MNKQEVTECGFLDKKLTNSRGTKSSGSSFRLLEVFNLFELSVDNRHNNHLCNPVQRLNGKSFTRTIPAGYFQFPLVI